MGKRSIACVVLAIVSFLVFQSPSNATTAEDTTTAIVTNFDQLKLAGLKFVGIRRPQNEQGKFDYRTSYLQTRFFSNATSLNEGLWDKFLGLFNNDEKKIVVRLDADFKNDLGVVTRVLSSFSKGDSDDFSASWNIKAVPAVKLSQNSDVEFKISFLQSVIEKEGNFFNDLGSTGAVSFLAPATAPMLTQASDILKVALKWTTENPQNRVLTLGLSPEVVDKFSHLILIDSDDDALSSTISSAASSRTFDLKLLGESNYIAIELGSTKSVLGEADAPFYGNSAVEQVFAPFISAVEKLGDDHDGVVQECIQMKQYAAKHFNFVNRDKAVLGLYLMSLSGSYNPLASAKHRRCFSDDEWSKYKGSTTWDLAGCESPQCQLAQQFVLNWYAREPFGMRKEIEVLSVGSQLSTKINEDKYKPADLIKNFKLTKFGEYSGWGNIQAAEICVVDGTDIRGIKATITIKKSTDTNGRDVFKVASVVMANSGKNGWCSS